MARPAVVAVATQNEHRTSIPVDVFVTAWSELLKCENSASTMTFVCFIQRSRFPFLYPRITEGRDINDIAMDLKDAFDKI